MKFRLFFRQCTAVFLAVIFVTNTVLAAPAAIAPKFDAGKLFSSGTVRGIINSQTSNAQTIIHIQDVHGNLEAQRNIAQTIRTLVESGQVGLVALEGAFGPIDVASYRNFPHQETTRKVAEFMLSQDKISGPIYAALTANRGVRVIGIDDSTRYHANVEAYRRAFPLIKITKEKLTQRRRELDRHKRAFFNRKLFAFDAKVSAYRDGTLPLAEYIMFLPTSFSGREVAYGDSAGRIRRGFLRAVHLEKSLNFHQVESERSRLLSQLLPRLSKSQTDDLTAAGAALRAGTLRQADFYTRLEDLSHQAGVSLAAYPALDGFIRYTKLADQIDGEALLTEIKELERRTYKTLVVTKQEHDLVAASRRLYLAEKLVGFSLTKEEWEEYKATNENRFSIFEAFYREAEARDKKMAENLLAAVTGPATVLVTGGFHASGIDQRLAAAGHTVITFVPKITKVDTENGASYLSVFNQQKSPLETLFQREKLFLPKEPFSLHGAQQPMALMMAANALAVGVGVSAIYLSGWLQSLFHWSGVTLTLTAGREVSIAGNCLSADGGWFPFELLVSADFGVTVLTSLLTCWPAFLRQLLIENPLGFSGLAVAILAGTVSVIFHRPLLMPDPIREQAMAFAQTKDATFKEVLVDFSYDSFRVIYVAGPRSERVRNEMRRGCLIGFSKQDDGHFAFRGWVLGDKDGRLFRERTSRATIVDQGNIRRMLELMIRGSAVDAWISDSQLSPDARAMYTAIAKEPWAMVTPDFNGCTRYQLKNDSYRLPSPLHNATGFINTNDLDAVEDKNFDAPGPVNVDDLSEIKVVDRLRRHVWKIRDAGGHLWYFKNHPPTHHAEVLGYKFGQWLGLHLPLWANRPFMLAYDGKQPENVLFTRPVETSLPQKGPFTSGLEALFVFAVFSGAYDFIPDNNMWVRETESGKQYWVYDLPFDFYLWHEYDLFQGEFLEFMESVAGELQIDRLHEIIVSVEAMAWESFKNMIPAPLFAKFDLKHHFESRKAHLRDMVIRNLRNIGGYKLANHFSAPAAGTRISNKKKFIYEETKYRHVLKVKDEDGEEWFVKLLSDSERAAEKFGYAVAEWLGMNVPTVSEITLDQLEFPSQDDQKDFLHEHGIAYPGEKTALLVKSVGNFEFEDLLQKDFSGIDELLVFIALMRSSDFNVYPFSKTDFEYHHNVARKKINEKNRYLVFDPPVRGVHGRVIKFKSNMILQVLPDIDANHLNDAIRHAQKLSWTELKRMAEKAGIKDDLLDELVFESRKKNLRSEMANFLRWLAGEIVNVGSGVQKIEKLQSLAQAIETDTPPVISVSSTGKFFDDAVSWREFKFFAPVVALPFVWVWFVYGIGVNAMAIGIGAVAAVLSGYAISARFEELFLGIHQQPALDAVNAVRVKQGLAELTLDDYHHALRPVYRELNLATLIGFVFYFAILLPVLNTPLDYAIAATLAATAGILVNLNTHLWNNAQFLAGHRLAAASHSDRQEPPVALTAASDLHPVIGQWGINRGARVPVQFAVAAADPTILEKDFLERSQLQAFARYGLHAHWSGPGKKYPDLKIHSLRVVGRNQRGDYLIGGILDIPGRFRWDKFNAFVLEQAGIDTLEFVVYARLGADSSRVLWTNQNKQGNARISVLETLDTGADFAEDKLRYLELFHILNKYWLISPHDKITLSFRIPGFDEPDLTGLLEQDASDFQLAKLAMTGVIRQKLSHIKSPEWVERHRSDAERFVDICRALRLSVDLAGLPDFVPEPLGGFAQDLVDFSNVAGVIRSPADRRALHSFLIARLKELGFPADAKQAAEFFERQRTYGLLGSVVLSRVEFSQGLCRFLEIYSRYWPMLEAIAKHGGLLPVFLRWYDKNGVLVSAHNEAFIFDLIRTVSEKNNHLSIDEFQKFLDHLSTELADPSFYGNNVDGSGYLSFLERFGLIERFSTAENFTELFFNSFHLYHSNAHLAVAAAPIPDMFDAIATRWQMSDSARAAFASLTLFLLEHGWVKSGADIDRAYDFWWIYLRGAPPSEDSQISASARTAIILLNSQKPLLDAYAGLPDPEKSIWRLVLLYVHGGRLMAGLIQYPDVFAHVLGHYERWNTAIVSTSDFRYRAFFDFLSLLLQKGKITTPDAWDAAYDFFASRLLRLSDAHNVTLIRAVHSPKISEWIAALPIRFADGFTVLWRMIVLYSHALPFIPKTYSDIDWVHSVVTEHDDLIENGESLVIDKEPARRQLCEFFFILIRWGVIGTVQALAEARARLSPMLGRYGEKWEEPKKESYTWAVERAGAALTAIHRDDFDVYRALEKIGEVYMRNKRMAETVLSSPFLVNYFYPMSVDRIEQLDRDFRSFMIVRAYVERAFPTAEQVNENKFLEDYFQSLLMFEIVAPGSLRHMDSLMRAGVSPHRIQEYISSKRAALTPLMAHDLIALRKRFSNVNLSEFHKMLDCIAAYCDIETFPQLDKILSLPGDAVKFETILATANQNLATEIARKVLADKNFVVDPAVIALIPTRFVSRLVTARKNMTRSAVRLNLFDGVLRAAFENRFGEWIEDEEANRKRGDNLGADLARHNRATRQQMRALGINVSRWLGKLSDGDVMPADEIRMAPYTFSYTADGDDRRTLTIRPFRRNPVHDIFFGDFTSCCLAMNSTDHPDAMIERLMDEGINVIEVIDDTTGETMAGSYLFIDKKGYLVNQNFEINSDDEKDLALKSEIVEQLIGYTTKFAKFINARGHDIGLAGHGKYDDYLKSDYGNYLVQRPEGIGKIGDYFQVSYYLDAATKTQAYRIWTKQALEEHPPMPASSTGKFFDDAMSWREFKYFSLVILLPFAWAWIAYVVGFNAQAIGIGALAAALTGHAISARLEEPFLGIHQQPALDAVNAVRAKQGLAELALDEYHDALRPVYRKLNLATLIGFVFYSAILLPVLSTPLDYAVAAMMAATAGVLVNLNTHLWNNAQFLAGRALVPASSTDRGKTEDITYPTKLAIDLAATLPSQTDALQRALKYDAVWRAPFFLPMLKRILVEVGAVFPEVIRADLFWRRGMAAYPPVDASRSEKNAAVQFYFDDSTIRWWLQNAGQRNQTEVAVAAYLRTALLFSYLHYIVGISESDLIQAGYVDFDTSTAALDAPALAFAPFNIEELKKIKFPVFALPIQEVLRQAIALTYYYGYIKRFPDLMKTHLTWLLERAHHYQRFESRVSTMQRDRFYAAILLLLGILPLPRINRSIHYAVLTERNDAVTELAAATSVGFDPVNSDYLQEFIGKWNELLQADFMPNIAAIVSNTFKENVYPGASAFDEVCRLSARLGMPNVVFLKDKLRDDELPGLREYFYKTVLIVPTGAYDLQMQLAAEKWTSYILNFENAAAIMESMPRIYLHPKNPFRDYSTFLKKSPSIPYRPLFSVVGLLPLGFMEQSALVPFLGLLMAMWIVHTMGAAFFAHWTLERNLGPAASQGVNLFPLLPSSRHPLPAVSKSYDAESPKVAPRQFNGGPALTWRSV